MNTGIDPSNLLTFRVSLLDPRYEKAPSGTQFLEQAVDQLGRLPGVRAVSAARLPERVATADRELMA